MRDPDGTVRPFENEAADEVAASLGLTVRNPETPELLGTTFLLVEPTVSEHDLVVAIERYWWPALEEDDFNAVVEGDEGLLHPRPRSDPVLASFRDADDETARDPVKMHVKAPAGFSAHNGDAGTFVGSLSHEAVVFEFASKPYGADWTGRLVAEVDLDTSEGEGS
ncbi:MAG: hypothetical protein OXG47_09645 [bacterium]|nr:hypothetical protein [bacterium]